MFFCGGGVDQDLTKRLENFVKNKKNRNFAERNKMR